MIRTMWIAAVALVVAGVAGLMTAEAQPGKVTKLGDIKRVEAAQKEFNTSIDALAALAKNYRGADLKAGDCAVDTKVYKDFIETKAVSWKQGGMKLNQLIQMQKQINARFDAIKKAGRLTDLDKKFLSQTTLSAMAKVSR